MNEILRNKLLSIAKEIISSDDPAHDFQHTYKVLLNAEKISKAEGGDLEIIIPAALFHDLIVYPKNHAKSNDSQEESSKRAEKILADMNEFPKDKINEVKTAILECSFSKKIEPSTHESKILQDADKLESTGVISIMRTFCSGGQMKKPFYNPKDPFCENREPDYKYSLDLFYKRLLLVKERIHTKTAKKIAEDRHKVLVLFLDELKKELK